MAEKLRAELEDNDIRTHIDARDEKLGYRIRAAQMEKVPYMLVIGDKEVESGNISVRSRTAGDLGTMTREDFIAGLVKENRTMSQECVFKK